MLPISASRPAALLDSLAYRLSTLNACSPSSTSAANSSDRSWRDCRSSPSSRYNGPVVPALICLRSSVGVDMRKPACPERVIDELVRRSRVEGLKSLENRADDGAREIGGDAIV